MAAVANNTQQSRMFIKCEGCKKGVEFYCNTCGSKFCLACKIGHLRNRISKDHDIVEFSDKIQSMAINYRARMSGCPIHPGAQYERCCKQCQVPVCAECIMDQHQSHPITKISSVYEVQRDHLMSESEEIKEKIIPNIEYFLGTVTGGAARLDAELQKMKLEMRGLWQSRTWSRCFMALI